MSNEGEALRILVVEDEKQVASFTKKGLQEEAHAVDVAYPPTAFPPFQTNGYGWL